MKMGTLRLGQGVNNLKIFAKTNLNGVLCGKTTPWDNCILRLCRQNHTLTKLHRFRVYKVPVLKIVPYRFTIALQHTASPGTSPTSVDVITPQSTSELNKTPSGTETFGTSSVGASSSTEIDPSSLPPIPSPSLPVDDVGVVLNQLGEPTLSSLGLGGWYPSGIIQQLLEFFHVTFNLPWWIAIAAVTATLRIVLLPFFIKQRRAMIRYSNNLPEFQMLNTKLSEARKKGNALEAAFHAQNLAKFSSEKKLFSSAMFIPVFIQLPVFLSVFTALKGLAKADVESFRNGGFAWFVDLSLPDQYYILPILTSATVWATIKTGMATGEVYVNPNFRNVFNRGLELGAPLVLFLFSMNFPSGTLCYWTTTNLFSLIQTFILNRPAVKKKLDIPPLIHNPTSLNTSKLEGGFIKGIQESFNNMKISREVEDRERYNSLKFRNAGSAPLQRTFKYDPTKPRPSPNYSLLQNDKKK